MKYQLVAIAAAGMAAAHPSFKHGHQHLHAPRQAPSATDDVMNVPGPTVIMYSLNGNVIPESEVMAGIANGTLVWANGAPVAAPSTSSDAASTSESAASVTISTNVAYSAPTSSTAGPTSTSVAASSSSTASNSNNKSSKSSSDSSSSSFSWAANSNVNTPFPDGQIDCSDFPSDYGAIPLQWLGLGGWSGIQSPGTSSSAGFDNIMTQDSTTCSGNNCCSEGNYCSYACPFGYQKSQWPETQGATAQSVGGLLCKNGKLHLTNSDLSNNLCITGASEVDVKVQNNLGGQVSICRTDYPGTESETIPLAVASGQTEDMTCPDEQSYYKWQGKMTSAQWYVNNQDVSVEDACQWGDGSKPTGNWAPLNLGTGYSYGMAYLSMMPNLPTTNEKLDFCIRLTGDGISSDCKYDPNASEMFCTDQGCNNVGCVVTIPSGASATYIMEDCS